MKKAVVIHELEGISELEYKGIDGEWTDVDVSSVADGPIEIEFDNYGVLDKEFLEGHFSVINIRYKVAEDYENPQLTLLGGKIQKDPKPDAEGWYTFDITIGRVNSHDDIEVWVDSDEYYVDMRLTAEKTTTTTYPAKFYVHEAGSNVYYPVGDGTVDFGEPTWEYAKNPIDLNIQENLDKVLTAPKAGKDFDEITVDGVSYEFSATAGVPNTYTFEGWDVAKAARTDDTTNKLEWHVDGIIVVNKAKPVLPGYMQPTVKGVNTYYDGIEHKVEVEYKSDAHKNRFTVTYQTKTKVSDEWGAASNEPPASTDVVNPSFYVKVTFTDRLDEYAPYVVGDKITGDADDNSVRFVILPRTVVVSVSNETITAGQADPQFTITASKDDNDPNSGLLAGHDLRR